MSVSEKVKCIEGRNKKLSISRQCELLQLPHSSYYRPRSSLTEGSDNLVLISLIDEEILRHPFYGSRKMKDYLNLRGIHVNLKQILRLMRLMGLESVAPKPNTRGWSGVVSQYHLHSAGTRLCLSDSRNGLGQSLCAVLGSLCDPGWCISVLMPWRVPCASIKHLGYSIQTREHNIQVRHLLVL